MTAGSTHWWFLLNLPGRHGTRTWNWRTSLVYSWGIADSYIVSRVDRASTLVQNDLRGNWIIIALKGFWNINLVTTFTDSRRYVTTPYPPHPLRYLLCLLPEVVNVRVHQAKERALRDKEVGGEKRKGGGAIVERGWGSRCDLLIQTFLDPTDSCSEWKSHIILCNICTGVNITGLSFN